tara:strand:+ start:7 stop:633 length:627 start_codon:yes stop_codon:yes gene_type:complete
MQYKSITRELSLLILSQISDKYNFSSNEKTLESLLSKALDSLTQYWREGLDECAKRLETAQQEILDSELKETDKLLNSEVRTHLRSSIVDLETVLNGLSNSLEIPRLLTLSDHEKIRQGAIERVNLVIHNMKNIDTRLDNVMEGWRLHRLPRIDRDILRLAVVDLIDLNIPPAVACNEAVELANRYSDEQGRKMINGILRRIQTNSSF